MRFRICHHGLPIAESDIDRLDPSMGIATGTFVPTAEFSAAASSFDATVTSEGGRELTSNLELRTLSGEVVPVEWIRLEDFSAVLGDEGYEVTACAADAAAFEKYFVSRDESKYPH